jgi:response regulator RpfG family c-di-GMP phosphodiesterase
LSERVYKKPWSVADALDYIEGQRGAGLDPSLVDILLEHREEFLTLRENIFQQSREVEIGEDEKKP